MIGVIDRAGHKIANMIPVKAATCSYQSNAKTMRSMSVNELKVSIPNTFGEVKPFGREMRTLIPELLDWKTPPDLDLRNAFANRSVCKHDSILHSDEGK